MTVNYFINLTIKLHLYKADFPNIIFKVNKNIKVFLHLMYVCKLYRSLFMDHAYNSKH